MPAIQVPKRQTMCSVSIDREKSRKQLSDRKGLGRHPGLTVYDGFVDVHDNHYPGGTNGYDQVCKERAGQAARVGDQDKAAYWQMVGHHQREHENHQRAYLS